MDTSTSPKHTALQTQIGALTELHDRVQALRRLPTLLLQPSAQSTSNQLAQNVRIEFQKIKEIGDSVHSDGVQQALRAAKDSFEVDGTGLNPNLRREMRKRRRPPSPESPRPIVVENEVVSQFPEEDQKGPSEDELVDYLREFNRTKGCKVQIWQRLEGAMLSKGSPLILRLTIKNVLIAYVHLDAMCIETVTVFGPREKKAPHAQSDYIVYQSLSQQLAKMIEQHPQLSLPSLLSLLCSYEGMFIEQCMICQRVLSAEGHVPPVVRIWTDGGWRGRHTVCR